MALQMKNCTTNLYSVSKENMSEKHAQPDRSSICAIEKARLKMNMKQHQIVKKSSPYA